MKERTIKYFRYFEKKTNLYKNKKTKINQIQVFKFEFAF